MKLVMKNNYPSVDDVRIISRTGRWPTKSGGELSVPFALNNDILTDFTAYDEDDLAVSRSDLRGIRSYQVSGLKKSSIGADEWHKIRNEIVSVTSGAIKWICEDLRGNKKEFIIDSTQSIYNPRYILHTYEALENHTEILVVANTLFFPEDASSHDTYSRDGFAKLSTSV